MIEQAAGQMTPRESMDHEWHVEEFKMQSEHQIVMKKLDIEQQKLEARWASWLRIPLTIIKLPIYILLGVGFCIAMATGHKVSKSFWNYLR